MMRATSSTGRKVMLATTERGYSWNYTQTVLGVHTIKLRCSEIEDRHDARSLCDGWRLTPLSLGSGKPAAFLL